MKLLKYICLITALSGCSQSELMVSSRFRGESKILEFHPNQTFSYYQRMEGGYVYEYAEGTWFQSKNKIFIRDDGDASSQLKIDVESYNSIDTVYNLIINIIPNEIKGFEYLAQVTDYVEFEINVDDSRYIINDLVNVISSDKPFNSISVRAYYKEGVEKQSEILIDTLTSTDIDVSGYPNKDIVLKVNCKPYSFARIVMGKDTLVMISESTLKWNEIKLRR